MIDDPLASLAPPTSSIGELRQDIPISKDELRRQLPLEYVLIECGIAVESTYGGRLQGLCIFHPDNEPSFDLYRVEGEDFDRCGCWSCRTPWHADIFDLLQTCHDVSFPEALTMAREMYGRCLAEEWMPSLSVKSVPKPDAAWFVSTVERSQAALRGDIEPLSSFCFDKNGLRDTDCEWLRKEFHLGSEDAGRIIIPHFDASGVTTALKYRTRDHGPMTALGATLNHMYGVWRVQNHENVYICEGESDTWATAWEFRDDPVDVLGLPSGASASVRREWLELFIDRDVTLLFDADHAGQAAIARWCHALSSVARMVRVAQLPDDCDVCETRHQGKLRGAVEAAEVRDPEKEAETTMNLGNDAQPRTAKVTAPITAVKHSLQELMAQELSEPEFYIDHVLAKGSITSLAGFIGAGKTPLILRLVKSVRSGGSFLDFEVNAPKDLPIAYLTQEAVWTFLPAAHTAGLKEDDCDIYFWHENAEIPWVDMVRQVSDELGAEGILIVDVVLDWSGAKDENDSATMTEAYKPLVAASGRGLAVLAVVHTVKGFDAMKDEDADVQHARGSGSVVAHSTIVLLYKKPRDSGMRKDHRFFKFGRSRFGMPERSFFYTQLLPDGRLIVPGIFEVAKAVLIDSKQRTLVAVRALNDAGEPATYDAIRKSSGLGKNHSDRTIQGLVDRGELTRSGEGIKGSPHVFEVA